MKRICKHCIGNNTCNKSRGNSSISTIAQSIIRNGEVHRAFRATLVCKEYEGEHSGQQSPPRYVNRAGSVTAMLKNADYSIFAFQCDFLKSRKQNRSYTFSTTMYPAVAVGSSDPTWTSYACVRIYSQKGSESKQQRSREHCTVNKGYVLDCKFCLRMTIVVLRYRTCKRALSIRAII
jgi:hypothetical protein